MGTISMKFWYLEYMEVSYVAQQAVAELADKDGHFGPYPGGVGVMIMTPQQSCCPAEGKLEPAILTKHLSSWRRKY